MKRFNSFIILIFTFGFLAGCSKSTDTNNSTTPKLDVQIASNPSYSIFDYAVKRAHLDIFTKGGGPYTFFVPTDDAFKLSGINSTIDIDKMDTIFLATLIGYHFQSGNRTYNEIPIGPNATLVSQTGITQYASRSNGSAYINGIKINDQGVSASNGIIYSVSEVLPYIYSNSNLEFLSGMGFTRMVQAITKAGIASSFTTNPSTIFAIPNNVMVANGYDSLAIAELSGTALTTLSNTLKYHVLPQRIFKSDFVPGSFQTRYTNNYVTISLSNAAFIAGKNNSSPIQILLPTFVTSTGFKYYGYTTSGVIYTVNTMLKP